MRDEVKFEILPYFIVDGYAPLPKNFYVFLNSEKSLSNSPSSSAGNVNITTLKVF